MTINPMARINSIRLFLLYVLCFHAGFASTAPEVRTWIVTPEADRKEGEQLQIACQATNLDNNRHGLMWGPGPPDNAACTVHMGMRGISETSQFNSMPYFDASTNTSSITSVTSNLRKGDSGLYYCSVCEDTGVRFGQRYILLNTSSVTLSVLYFPGESFPVCSPVPHLPVDPGTELILHCSSDTGNPAVTMDIAQTTTGCDCYGLNLTRNESGSTASLILTVDVPDSGKKFKCTISSVDFPGKIRSCTFGPILVTDDSPAIFSKETSPTPPRVDPTNCDEDGPTTLPITNNSPPITWMTAFMVTLLLLVVSMGLNLLLLRTLKSKPKQMINNNILHAQEPWPQNPEPDIELNDMDATPQHTNEPEEVSFEETEN